MKSTLEKVVSFALGGLSYSVIRDWNGHTKDQYQTLETYKRDFVRAAELAGKHPDNVSLQDEAKTQRAKLIEQEGALARNGFNKSLFRLGPATEWILRDSCALRQRTQPGQLTPEEKETLNFKSSEFLFRERCEDMSSLPSPL